MREAFVIGNEEAAVRVVREHFIAARTTLASSPPGAVGGAEKEQDEGWTKKDQPQAPQTSETRARSTKRAE
jgi:hypothetical protein